MKKIMFSLVFILLNTFVFSQARIGYSELQIRNEFYYCKFDTNYNEKGQKYIGTGDFEKYFIIYYFDENNICYACTLMPKTTGYLNYFVEKYNNDFVIISNTQWKFYNENGIMFVTLIFGSEITYFLFE
jgi:hypothetical protein